MTYDICVVGLGAIGSAIAEHCARRGARVIGLEQFSRGHELGSSAGRTRMIRQAYFEDPAYVPLVRRSYELWSRLEAESGENLLTLTGVLAVGKEESEIIVGTQRASEEHGVPIELLSAPEIVGRYPIFQLQADEVGILEPGGGVLQPERAIGTQLKAAQARGAELRFNSRMTGWQWRKEHFEVALADGSIISAQQVVLAVGPWFQAEAATLGVRINVQRNVQVWFEAPGHAYAPDQMPAFLLDREGLPSPLYGFANFGEGVKVAFHGFGESVDPDEIDREVDQEKDIAPVTRALEPWMPGLPQNSLAAKICMYSLTPDQHFVIDRHPEYDRLLLCGGFSGHGFKFAPVIGEIAAEWLLDGETQHAIDFLSLHRFSSL